MLLYSGIAISKLGSISRQILPRNNIGSSYRALVYNS